ncbi:MAG TPA: hypothetical protein VFD74_09150 [Thermoleophilia bacterium]|nr:hypothetical protein [Thermoleophilia bacterium]
MRSAWARLTHKQLLFVYPLILGVINVVAFFAVYASVGGRLSFSEFAQTDFTRWTFLQEHIGDLAGGLDHALIALLAGAAICLLSAAVRAPYFRAIAGSSYPRSPRSTGEFVRLAQFYAFTYAVFYIVPYLVAVESAAGQALSLAVLPLAILLVFGDYALVFESLSPIAAAKRSIKLLRRGWMMVIPIYLVALLLWSGSFALFDRYYQSADGVFPLFVVSQLLVEALITLLLDVVLIFTYDHLRRL